MAGLSDTAILQRLEDVRVATNAIVTFRALADEVVVQDKDCPAGCDQLPLPRLPRRSLKLAVQAAVQALPSTSSLRQIAWDTILVGESGVFEAKDIYNTVASTVYALLQQAQVFRRYQSSLVTVAIPSASSTVDLALYHRWVRPIPEL